MSQLTLIAAAGREKSLATIAVDKLTVSRFNTRKTRAKADVEKLAKRIAENGFELTRAPWAYKDGKGYEVFAGGTRLEAAKLAGESEIPVILFTGFGEEDYAKLADEDNENDEHHAPVSPLDIWAEYHRLATEEGWTQQKIAEAKSTDVPTVSLRVKCHTALPEIARRATLDGILDEGHCIAFLGLTLDIQSLAPWLTTAQAQTELVSEVLGKHRGSSAGIKPTVKVVREAAAKWKAMIAHAVETIEKLDEKWRAEFVTVLVRTKARTSAAVDEAFVTVARKRDAERAEALRAAETAADKERNATELAARIAEFSSRVLHVDARETLDRWPAETTLLLTDPPYGMGYQSGRRTTSAKKARVAGDDDGAEAVALLADVLKIAFARMAENSTALVFTGWRLEPAFREAIVAAGFTLKGSLVWVKHNHGTGDLKGSFAPRHERILHAIKGNPSLRERPDDVLFGKDEQDSEHPTEKPQDLLKQLIAATTDADQMVVDPFAGSGSALFAAHALGRKFWGCEIDEPYHRTIVERLHEIATREVGAPK